MAEEFRVLRPYEFHCQLIKGGKRADGRKLHEFRDIRLEVDAITTANSSSLVKLGNTSLVCGCVTRLISLEDNCQSIDNVNIHVELPPISSCPNGHRTQHNAQLLTKTLKNILEDMDCFDLSCLTIPNQSLMWSVDVEVICLNYDGCLLDGALLGVLAALQSLELVDSAKGHRRNFKLNKMPIRSSFAIIGDRIICDPNLEEENVAQSTLSITVETSGNVQDCHIYKQGGKAIKVDQLNECIGHARKRASVVVKQLSESNSRNGATTMDCT